MSDNARRRSTKNLTRRERRAAHARSYTAPAPTTPQSFVAPRRSYMAEPAPVDYSVEYGYVRHDLRRILFWATLLVIAMIALAFLPIFG